MTKASYISAGIAAIVLAFSITGAPALAADGACIEERDGFKWNACDGADRRTKRVPAGAAAPAGPADEPARPRGIFSTFLPDVEIDYDPGYPGDTLGGADGAGDGGGDR